MSRSTYSLGQRATIKLRQFAYKSQISEPYLSGDAFAKISNFVIRNEIDLKTFSTLSSIPRITFCRSDLVTQLRNLNVKPEQHCILIAGNGDFDFTDSKILPLQLFQTFFLQNSSISDNKKIFTLPIGVENLSLGINGLPKNLHSTQDWKFKSKKVMVGPFSPTHKDRVALLEKACLYEEVFEIMQSPISPRKFADVMTNYQFVACPRGNGMDTHRFWETLYRGSIPIVKKSEWSESLAILGIPYLIVDDWEDTPKAIESFQKNFNGFNPKDLESLWIGYWEDKFASD